MFYGMVAFDTEKILKNKSLCIAYQCFQKLKAFWQLPLKDESKEMAAFTIRGFGCLQLIRFPFGVYNAAQS